MNIATGIELLVMDCGTVYFRDSGNSSRRVVIFLKFFQNIGD